LNYLGMKVRYHDIAKGLPDEKTMQGVYGILTWFRDNKMTEPYLYCEWASEQIRKGKKFVILDRAGAYGDYDTGRKTTISALNSLFSLLGLEYQGEWTDNPLVIEVLEKDSRMVEFERTLEGELNAYEKVVSLDERNKIYFKLNRTDIADGESAAMVVAPRGGFVLQDYALFINYATDEMRWRINPFLFF